MEDVSFQEYATAKQGPRFPKKILFLFLFLLVLAGIGLVGYGSLKNSVDESVDSIPTSTPSPSPFPSDTPTPTEVVSITPGKGKPTATPTKAAAATTTVTGGASSSIDKTTGLDRATLKVKVLNGSGVAGAAKKVADTLTAAGYVVSGTGNADTFDYEGLTIQVLSTKSKYAPLLKKDLAASYTVSETTTDLASGDGADAVVIVGKE